MQRVDRDALMEVARAAQDRAGTGEAPMTGVAGLQQLRSRAG